MTKNTASAGAEGGEMAGKVGEESTSLCQLLWISCFCYCKRILLFTKTSQLNEEAALL
jgi:hypothetical protein